MKIPDKVKIGPMIYSVVYEDKPVEDNQMCLGICRHADRQIVLKNNMSKHDKKITLFHEVLHVIEEVYDVELGEHRIRLLETGIMDFIITNKLNFLK